MIQTCVRRLQFSAGHRVLGHENKCANLHGHNYVVFIHARPKEVGQNTEFVRPLDPIGRVIEFADLKEKFGTWLDVYWDHGFLLNEKDQDLQEIRVREEVNTLKWYSCPFNPTAEEMAKYLLLKIAPVLMANTNAEVFKIRVEETENCYAEAEL